MFVERDISKKDKKVKRKKKNGFTETPLKIEKSKPMTEMIESDLIKPEVKEIKKDVKEEINFMDLLLPKSSYTEDKQDDFQDDSGDDGDGIEDKKFMEEIAFLDGKKKKIMGTRGYAVPEIQNNTTDDNRVEMDDLLTSLDKGTSDLSRRAAISKNKDVLPAQLHRQAEERINQAAGYQRVRGEVNAWGSIVEENRVGENLSFPLQEPDIAIKTASEVTKSRFAPETPLEIQIAQMLAGSASTMKEGEELSELEVRALEGLTAQEIRERRAELAKFRALRQYQVKRKIHQNKIKSKSYRKIVRRIRNKQKLADLENLAETDPVAAAHEIEMLNRNRILERATLKHRNASKHMQDLKKRQRLTKSAEVRKDFQGQMQDQIAKHRDMIAKPKIVSDSEDEENDKEEDSEDDDYIEANKEESYDDFASGYRKYWEAQQAEKKKKLSAVDEIEDMFDEADYARKEAIAMKKRKRADNKNNDESNSDNDQDEETVDNLDAPRTRVSAISGSNTKQLILPGVNESTIDNQEEGIRDANADIAAARNKTTGDTDASTTQSNQDNKNKKTDVDPDDFMVVKPKKLKSGVPEIYGYNDDGSDEEENKQRQIIAEAFINDDVLEDFAKEKAAIKEANTPKDIDLFLPGWGSWGGTGIEVNQRKKERYLFKAPPPAKRRDDNKQDVIVNYDKDTVIKQHQVSRIPYYFNSVSDFEASIRAPIGDTFIPRTAHLQLIKPRVTTKMGRVIEPMDKSSLLKKNAEVIEELKLFQNEDFEEKMKDAEEDEEDNKDKPQSKRARV